MLKGVHEEIDEQVQLKLLTFRITLQLFSNKNSF